MPKLKFQRERRDGDWLPVKGYRLPPEVVAEAKELAAELRLPESKVAEYALRLLVRRWRRSKERRPGVAARRRIIDSVVN